MNLNQVINQNQMLNQNQMVNQFQSQPGFPNGNKLESMVTIVQEIELTINQLKKCQTHVTSNEKRDEIDKYIRELMLLYGTLKVDFRNMYPLSSFPNISNIGNTQPSISDFRVKLEQFNPLYSNNNNNNNNNIEYISNNYGPKYGLDSTQAKNVIQERLEDKNQALFEILTKQLSSQIETVFNEKNFKKIDQKKLLRFIFENPAVPDHLKFAFTQYLQK
jgi:RecG-like helicase